MKNRILKSASICFIVLMLLILTLAGCDIDAQLNSAYGYEAGMPESSSEMSLSREKESTGHEETGSVFHHFRNDKLLKDHYEKHGIDMGFSTAEEYEKAASRVVSDPDALHKTESDDGDDVYYLKESNEFVVVSTDGYIRTYFLPDSGIAYFNRQ